MCVRVCLGALEKKSDYYPLVRLRVLLQVALSDKLFGARLALKGLFVRVNFLVPDQVGALA